MGASAPTNNELLVSVFCFLFKEYPMPDYIPSNDPVLSAWANNFSEKIAATPGAYGLMASDAAAIAAAFDLFDDALAQVLDPATKTKSAVADKNAKKATMLATMRNYAQTIKRNRGVSNDAKIDLGLRVSDGSPTPIPAPTTVPVLAIASDMPLVQSVEFRDITTPDRKAKPEGVIGMMLVVVVAPAGAAVPNPENAPVHGIATRNPYRVQFTAEERGKVAYYFGRWITGAGKVGPWSAMAQLSIAG
jgi:hypothetical protein